jgi:DNA primase
VFCFDGDDAGRRAAWRALENSLEQLVDGKQLLFLFLPQGEDPDTYVRKLGKEAFEKLLGDALPLSQFMLRELSSRVDLNTHEGRARLLQDAKPLVTQIKARFLGRMIRQNLAQIAGITLQDLDREYGVREFRSAHAAPPRTASASVRTPARKAIELLMLRPDLHKTVDRNDLLAARGAPKIKPEEIALLEALLDIYAESTTTKIGEYFRDSDLEKLVREIEVTLLDRPEASFQEDELKEQFLHDWNNLKLAIGEGLRVMRRKILQEKQNLSPEEQSEYKGLLQPQRTGLVK